MWRALRANWNREGSSEMAAAASARIKNRAVRRRGIAMEPLGVGIRISGKSICYARLSQSSRRISQHSSKEGNADEI